MTAMDDLNALLSPLPGYAVLTDPMKQNALNMALIPDINGVWPGGEGYIATYDVYWAATSLTGYMMAQPFVRAASSEGTSTTVDAPQWSSIIAFFQSQSVISSVVSTILVEVPIPGLPHVVHTDMSGRGSDYGDVDTDLA